ncbi:MAG: hypothetical protein RIR48_2385 [Bacteroidota bacterium]|jgi:hypothetical protein
MLKNILKTLQETTEVIVEKAAELNDVAKEKINDAKEHTKDKVLSLIEEWVIILPKLADAGLTITSFGVSMSLNPCLTVEMKGNTRDFGEDQLQKLLEQYKNEKTVKLLLNAIKSTILMHKKAGLPFQDDLIVKLEVKLSPEIKVFIGKPTTI